MKNLKVINEEFNATNISKYQFTISLITECVRVKILDNSFIYTIQVKISDILKELIMKYTKGESSSVTVEKAEKLIIATWYTIDAYVSSFISIEESINVIKNEEPKDLYKKGREVLREEFENTKKLYEATLKNKLDTELIAYNDTLINGIGDFFKFYNEEFEPDESPGSIDYPLAFDDWDLKGLFYIKNYIWNLYIENKICNYFSKEQVNLVLEAYGNMYDINYRDLLINIFEITITNAIFSIMSKYPSDNLYINEQQFKYLNTNLKNLNEKEVSNLINLCTDKLICELNIVDEYEVEYINRFIENLIKTTLYNIKKDNLKNILVITEIKEIRKNNFVIDEENKLDDEEFRAIIGKLLECETVFEKIRIINEKINCTKDFIDVLKSNCFFEDEYIDLFMSLTNMELAMLGKFVLYGEYRMERLDLEKLIKNKIETHNEFEEYYIEFLKSINKNKLHTIEDLIKNLTCK